jgi:hypothetical protein
MAWLLAYYVRNKIETTPVISGVKRRRERPYRRLAPAADGPRSKYLKKALSGDSTSVVSPFAKLCS